MYYTRVWEEHSQSYNFIISQGDCNIKQPLNDLEKIKRDDFWLDGSLKGTNKS